MKKIGDYEVLGLLGKGGMSKVYKVRLPALNKIMALKLLSPHAHLTSLLGMDEMRRRFLAEARVMEELASPHIVETLDVGAYDEKPFIVMENYCRTLGHVIGETCKLEHPGRTLRLDKAVQFAQQTLMGLNRLHQHGIVHRDIKPFNLLLTEDETVRITDFGRSKVRGEVFSGPRQLLVGSPYYAAPEQEGHPDKVDPRADLYSTGVVLYRMLTGRLPVDGRIMPGDLHPELDREWHAFFAKALDPDRARRYPNAETMLASLHELLRQWVEKTQKTCAKWEPLPPEADDKIASKHSLRAVPVKIAPRSARELFGCDELWRPKHFFTGVFTDNGDGTVSHKATGLMWQKAGSESRLTWREAHRYVAWLNTTLFAGKTRWRLPTVEELMSLLTPVPCQDDYCIEPVFGRERKWLWSTDRRSFAAAWYISVDMGYVSWQDYTCRFYEKAVLSFPDV